MTRFSVVLIGRRDNLPFMRDVLILAIHLLVTLARRFVNLFKAPAAWVPLLAAELVGVRPVCTKLRAGILSCCGVLGEGLIRMHCENKKHEGRDTEHAGHRFVPMR
jgi:hypothetical protein